LENIKNFHGLKISKVIEVRIEKGIETRLNEASKPSNQE
jgi:hypothetical protein